MSPFSKVEMSPFVIVKIELQDKGDGKSDVTSHERTGIESGGGSATGQAKELETTGSSRTVGSDSAANKALVQSLSGRRCGGTDFPATGPTFKQSAG